MRETGPPTPSGHRQPRLGFFFALALFLSAACSGGASSPEPTVAPTAAPTQTLTATVAPVSTPTRSAPTSTPTATVSPTEALAFPLTLVDYDGTEVVIAAEPQRIVSLTPAATETLFAIGAGDRVVGKVEDIANFPPEASQLPVVGTFAGVDVEQIVDLETDLVIAGGLGGTSQDTIDQLRDLGVPVLVVYAPDVETVMSDIELIGRAVGDADAAMDLTASMRGEFDQIESATRDLLKPNVFYETGDVPVVYGVADDSFVTAMIELAGAEPITTGSSTNWEMPSERLVDANPEVILLGDAAYGVTAEAVTERPGWAELTAVQNGAIYPIDDIVVTRPGPRLAEGLRALVEVIHPEVELPEPSPFARAAASGAML